VTQRPAAGCAGLIGSPVAHSLSPAIHRAAFAAAGLEWVYAAFDVAPGRAAEALDAMRVLGLRGLSVTMPHKEQVAGCVDRLDPAARSLRSVNTVSWDGDLLVGWSTDGAGFIASLTEQGITVDGARVAVIGAGGAARSVVDSLGRAGAAAVVVVNRTSARAAEAAALAPVGRVAGGRGDVTGCDVVVNATSVGMGIGADSAGPSDLPCDVALLRPDHVVVDLVYYPRRTAWLEAAAAIGARTVDGLGMLVHQAALQQEIWTGCRPDVGAMRNAAEAALAER
jgi:shikimate dehydrogenase